MKGFHIAAMIFALALTGAAGAKVQCSCPKVPADGEGNTSCSASESSGRCTIDFNLFGEESEKRAAELLNKFGGASVKPPDTRPPAFEAYAQMSALPKNQLVDTILVYLTVAAGNQSARAPGSVPLSDLKELVVLVRRPEVADEIVRSFGIEALQQWIKVSDDRLRRQPSSFSGKTIGRMILAPGCIEFTLDGRLWLMFKAAWSPARVLRRCTKD